MFSSFKNIIKCNAFNKSLVSTSRFMIPKTFCSVTAETMDADIVIVGAGPAGLSAAIRAKQLAKIRNQEISVVVFEKGSSVGSHILSGNVFETRALKELFPNFEQMSNPPPLHQKVKEDKFYVLTKKKSFKIPDIFLPPELHNENNYIISLAELTKWLSDQAEELGVEIYSGFPVEDVITNKENKITGVKLKDKGIGKDKTKLPTYEPGMIINSKQVIVAEGCFGSLTEKLVKKYNLREKSLSAPSFSLGVKEVWEIDDKYSKPGLVLHTVGYPLSNNYYGGGFIYHIEKGKILVGLIVGLDYDNPYISPYKEMQEWKLHPDIKKYFDNGRCISYGARTISTGGIQSLPKALIDDNCMLVGDGAGFLNLPKIKGTHTAMKSGIIAADNAVQCIIDKRNNNFEKDVKNSWLYKELYKVRNIKPAFRKFKLGLFGMFSYSGLSLFLTKGKEPWTFTSQKLDSEYTQPAANFKPPNYSKPDNKITFDLLDNLIKTNTFHEENQPSHLKVKDHTIPLQVSLPIYGGPEQYFCPAKVYEYVDDGESGKKKLQINAQNCIHCKTCGIKPYKQFIEWTVPEGGGGPNYENM